MSNSLLAEFLEYEMDSTVRQRLKDAMADPEPRKALREFAFNRFNVTLDFERKMAVVDDELDPSPEGSVELALEQFAQLLE